MGASSSRARGWQREGGPVVVKEAPRQRRQPQKPLPQPQRRAAATTRQAPSPRVEPATVSHNQGPLIQNASSNSDNIQVMDRRQVRSVNDARNSTERTEASQVTQAIKTLNVTCDDKRKLDVTCGLEAPEVQEEPKGSNSALPEEEEEEECAICLEGYDEKNPKRFIQCEHHYHFQCMLEWLERNYTCPICGRIAIFAEKVDQLVHQLPVESMDQ